VGAGFKPAPTEPAMAKADSFFLIYHTRRVTKFQIEEALATVTYSVIPAKAGIQNSFLDSGSRFACPE